MRNALDPGERQLFFPGQLLSCNCPGELSNFSLQTAFLSAVLSTTPAKAYCNEHIQQEKIASQFANDPDT